MNNLEKICARLPVTELLAQLAEEAAELGHAALKLRRVIDGRNYTPVTYEQAVDSLHEEIADITNAMDAIDIYLNMDMVKVLSTRREKQARWAERLERV
jgi:NTP pyrophosphatase (non-canonical NTP hydrolase)